MTADLKDVFKYFFTPGQFEMSALVEMVEVEDGSGYDVQVQWVGFEDDEDTWEPLSKIWNAAICEARIA